MKNEKKLIYILFKSICFLYLVRILTLKYLFIFIGSYILYWILKVHIKKGIRNKYMLKVELTINKYLKKIVVEKTREISKTNDWLEELSNKDSLTGLYNRKYFLSYLDSLFDYNMYNSWALLYIDINRFKAINDSCSYEIGDKVLQTLGNRFSEKFTVNPLTFRIEGDKFAILLHRYSDKKEISLLAKKVLEIIESPILINSYVFNLTASIGIALYPDDANDKDLIIKYADLAMYEIKRKYHKNNYLFFNSALSKKAERRQEIEFLLKNADYDKEFVLYYQPQYSASGNTLIGMEALIRWIHPEKGFISPSEFIPIAEEIGLIIDISEWVINKAFSQIKKWNQIYKLNLKIGINISPIQIENTDFINCFQKKLKIDNIKTNWVDVEITEGSAMNPNLSIEKIFDSLNEMGISTAIDDFGTGYSSLSYIRKFNITRLKIAKELIDNICEDKNSLLIVQAIIMMARGMGLKTIAEGVEYENQLEILKELGCDEIQGYVFGRPVSSEEFEKEHINKLVKTN